MQNTSGNQSQNQPNRNDQVKGGQHSHQGGSNDSKNSPTDINENDQHNQNRPGKEAPVKGVKGGQPPRAGGNK